MDAAELDAVAALIVGEQGRPERMITSLGDEADGLRAELDALEPPWSATVRVVRDEVGALAGAVLVEWDPEAGRAWIHGPWVPGEEDRWARFARPLVDAAVVQVPAEILKREVVGHVDNVRLAALARALGWPAGEVNHVLLADRSLIDGWPEERQGSTVRAAAADDLAVVGRLHDADFPATYASADQLLRDAGSGERVVLVAEASGGGVVGYAAGRVQPDGEGYIEFVAVDPAARGDGLGRQLVIALTRQLVARSSKERVALTVREDRAAARALYAQLGFRTLLSMVGYGTPAGAPPPSSPDTA